MKCGIDPVREHEGFQVLRQSCCDADFALGLQATYPLPHRHCSAPMFIARNDASQKQWRPFICKPKTHTRKHVAKFYALYYAWYELFGITSLEAMACSVPMIGSAVGGMKHTVVDGGTSYMVPPNDTAAVAEQLALLHAQPAEARRMGRERLAARAAALHLAPRRCLHRRSV